MKIKFISILAAGVLLLSCSASNEKTMKVIIDEALLSAEKQSLVMALKYADKDNTYPRTFDNGKDITSGSDWWCSGFFPGVLWYLYENSNNPELLKYAKQYTEGLEKEKDNTGTHDLGFMLYCSFGNGYRLTKDESYKNIMLTGAASLATRYDQEIGLIRSWDFGNWQYPVIIDNMMNLEFLLWAANVSGNSFYKELSVSHANKTIENHYRDDYSCFHVVSYDTISGIPEKKQNFQGFSDESAWSRGQAWGLYGYVVMYRETKDKRFLEQAVRIADFTLNHPNMPDDYIPYWDYNAPGIPGEPRDASAGALTASTLIELSGYVDKELSDKYLKIAEIQLRTLASPEYTAPIGENGGFVLMHSVGSLAHNSEVDVPLTYADYYYIEALMRYRKLIK